MKVAYHLELPTQLSRIHNIFHISLLKKYQPDPRHIIQHEELELQDDLSCEENPIKILEREITYKGKKKNL